MKYLILFVSVLLAFFIGLHVGRADVKTQYEERVEAMQKNLEALKKKYTTLADIISCESGGKHEVYGDGGRAYGIAQFHKSTFEAMAKKSGCENCRYTSRIDQLRLLSWAYDNGKINKWSCYDSQ